MESAGSSGPATKATGFQPATTDSAGADTRQQTAAGTTAILIITWDLCAEIADFSIRALHSAWSPHPPVYACGTSRPIFHEAKVIAMPHGASSWIATLHHACTALLAGGFRYAYLILDDQPPLGPCHPHHLNVTLPNWMETWSATNVSLINWDSVFRSRGTFMPSAHGDVLRLSPTLANRFSLHPGLWDLASLRLIASTFSGLVPADAQTPWAFEDLGKDGVRLFEPRINCGFFRICGGRMAAFPRRFPPQSLVELEARWRIRILARGRHMVRWRRAWMSLLQAVGGPASRAFHGPYPHYYSGLLARRRPNAWALRYMRDIGDAAWHKEASGLLDSWSQKVAPKGPQTPRA